jgi:hypothetical protein
MSEQSIRLFRYFKDLHALDFLERGMLHVGRIAEFNDYFEWRPGVHGHSDDESEKLRIIMDKCFDGINTQYGIICFSESCSEPILWSTYGDRHKGIVIEFDIPKGPSLEKVNYCCDRLTIDVENLRGGKISEDAKITFLECTFNKAIGWSFEKEWRLSVLLEKQYYDGANYWLKIDALKYVKRIIFGEFCIGAMQAKVERFLERTEYKHVLLAKAKRSLKTYEIETHTI